MKKGRKAKHHHHRIASLLIQYDHLNAEQRADAFEADVFALAAKLDAITAGRVLDKLRERFRAHR